MLSQRSVIAKAKRLAESARYGRIGIRDFENAFPDISAQLRKDADAPWLPLWGQSLNRDQLAGHTIVDPKILSVIGRIAKTKIRDRNGYHAGLIHTYGYLFSWLATPYGLKHERWTEGIIAKGLGLPHRLFQKNLEQGTFLQNVTVLLTHIVLRRQKSALRELQKVIAPPSLASYSVSHLASRRITETFTVPVPNSSRQSYRLLTDIIEFKRAISGYRALLVYSYDTGHYKSNRLITCFPISKSTIRELTTESRFGKKQLLTPDFNIFLPHFRQQELIGERKIDGD